jgi:hypothetical protein
MMCGFEREGDTNGSVEEVLGHAIQDTEEVQVETDRIEVTTVLEVVAV